MDKFEEDLIKCVRNYPSLYGKKGLTHRKLYQKEQMWTIISEKLNKSSQECKNKWRNIRDSYRKVQNRKRIGLIIAQSKYDDPRLKFLDEALQEDTMDQACSGRSQSPLELPIASIALQSESSDMPPDSPSVSRSTPTSETGDEVINQVATRKRKRLSRKRKNSEDKSKLLQESTDRSSSIHVFFNTMADIVSGFPPEQIAQVRLEVCKIVTDVELTLLGNQACLNTDVNSKVEIDIKREFIESSD